VAFEQHRQRKVDLHQLVALRDAAGQRKVGEVVPQLSTEEMGKT